MGGRQGSLTIPSGTVVSPAVMRMGWRADPALDGSVASGFGVILGLGLGSDIRVGSGVGLSVEVCVSIEVCVGIRINTGVELDADAEADELPAAGIGGELDKDGGIKLPKAYIETTEIVRGSMMDFDDWWMKS